MLGLERYLADSKLDPKLLSLIKIRASQINSQINRCAFCIDMHTQEAKKSEESDRRIFALNAWQETPWFSAKERAVLSLTEAVTLIAEQAIDDKLYAEVSNRSN